jgi:GNAT superfamily N-acetyltransferase
MTDGRIEPLRPDHDRSDFDCGEESLNRFLREFAGQHARKDMSRTYVAIPAGARTIVGYYCLSSGSISFETLPLDAARRLPRHPIPTAHLGRLAVDRRHQGRGLGERLLVDALQRVLDAADRIGIHAVTVHALNDRARSFYLSYGFIPLADDPGHLFLPMATIREM